jgi:serine/threonine protein kinase/DNA-binding SARP family transcriptional activator
MNKSTPRLETILAQAVEIATPEERQAFIERACADDGTLLRHVERLIANHFQAGSFLERPALAVDPERTVAWKTIDSAVGPGTIIGPYKLLEPIGEGGMGVVYRAEQTNPVRRHVALKIIKPGMDTGQVIARFEAERQALALMDHPSIAKVLDAGATDTGRPYFVMELVKGVPITTYCDTVHSTSRERLELFIPVCQAIQHAHQKGIIHRDIKPSNVLIAMVDGKAVPKMIDFGVAKAIDQRLTERTMFTQHGAIVGTFEYMSPEQAELSGMDIDTRSDIYALGVLLYELLTGSTPLEKEKLRAAAYSEILRLIKEEEPPKPSTRLSDSGDRLASLAAQRRTEPARLAKQLRGDLDWIVMKAIDKDRTRRYETANGFARDIQRHLAGDPVEAGPPSAWYKLRKFARKHRAVLVTIASFAALLLFAATVGTYLAIRATNAERRASGEAERAKRSAAESETVRRFLENNLLAAARPKGEEGGLGKDATIRQAVDAAQSRIAETFKDQPVVEAAVRATLGTTYWHLGEYSSAIRELERAVKLREFHLGSDHPHTLDTGNELAVAYRGAGRMPEAITMHEATLKRRESKLGPDHPDTLESRNNLAYAYLDVGRTQEAIKLLEAILKLQESKVGPDHPDALGRRNNLATAYYYAGRHAEAIEMLETIVKLHESTLGPDHAFTLKSRNNLAAAYNTVGRTADAVKMHEATLRLIEAKLGPDHPDTLVVRYNLARAFAAAGRNGDAIEMFEALLMPMGSKLGTEHADTLTSHNQLARAYFAAGRNGDAIKVYEALLKHRESKLGPDHTDTLTTRNDLARSYQAAGRLTDALPLFEDALKRFKTKLGSDHPTTLIIMNNVAAAYLEARRWAEAERTARACLGLRERKQPDDWWRFGTLSQLGAALAGQKKYAAAEPLLLQGYRGLIARATKIPPQFPYRSSLVEATKRIVRLYDALGHPDKADAILRPEDRDLMMPNGPAAFAR